MNRWNDVGFGLFILCVGLFAFASREYTADRLYEQFEVRRCLGFPHKVYRTWVVLGAILIVVFGLIWLVISLIKVAAQTGALLTG
jgi:uncharacterized membrane protein